MVDKKRLDAAELTEVQKSDQDLFAEHYSELEVLVNEFLKAKGITCRLDFMMIHPEGRRTVRDYPDAPCTCKDGYPVPWCKLCDIW